MEQGNCLDSTRMSARQEVCDTSDEPGLDAAVTALLTRPVDDADAMQLSADSVHTDRLVIGQVGRGSDYDLATACIDQVNRLAHWDANPDSVSEEQGDAEMDRSIALFRRAIDNPSSGLRDLAGKAHLMLDDLDRFHPIEQYSTDNYRLMRVILSEALKFGGLADPIAAPQPDPILAMIEEGRRLLRVSQALHARPEGSTTEDEQAAEVERGEALQTLWTHVNATVLKTVPLTAAGCRELARFGVEYFECNDIAISDDEQAITRLIAQSPLQEANGHRSQSIDNDADAELLALGREFNSIHAEWVPAALCFGVQL